MNVTICSIFRNSQPYLKRYLDQLDQLFKLQQFGLALGEGDSTDDTRRLLEKRADVLDVSHGGLHYGSVDNPDRWEQISRCVRPVLKYAMEETNPDVLVWVESDLIWEPDAMLRLIKGAVRLGAVAPMVFAEGEDRFYDTYGFRQHGKRFTPGMPYMVDDSPRDNEYVKIDSCGSCFATNRLHHVRYWNGHWPYNPDGGLWLDTHTSVTHPK